MFALSFFSLGYLFYCIYKNRFLLMNYFNILPGKNFINERLNINMDMDIKSQLILCNIFTPSDELLLKEDETDIEFIKYCETLMVKYHNSYSKWDNESLGNVIYLIKNLEDVTMRLYFGAILDDFIAYHLKHPFNKRNFINYEYEYLQRIFN